MTRTPKSGVTRGRTLATPMATAVLAGRVLSLAQPTADSLHLGNFLGALRPWVPLQEKIMRRSTGSPICISP